MSLARTAFFSPKMRAIAAGVISSKVKDFADKMQKVQSSAPQIMAAAMQEITPAVRGELARNYASAGLKEKTGALFSAAVTNAQVWLKNGGIKVTMAAGSDDRLYKIGASLNYGAVHAPRMEGDYKDLPTGEMRTTVAGYRTAIGGRAKRTLKEYFFKGRSFSKREKFAAALAAGAKTTRGGWYKAKRISVPNESQVPQRSIRERMIVQAVKGAGGIKLIRPHRFFYFSPSFSARAQGLLLDAVKRQIRARGLGVQ